MFQRKLAESKDEDGEGSQIKLRTFGRPNTYTIRKGKIQRRRKITYDIIKKAKLAANLTVRQTNKLLAHLRHGVGHGWVVSRIRDKVTLANKLFDGDFISEYVNLEVGGKESNMKVNDGANKRRAGPLVLKPHPLVYVAYLKLFIKKILEKRGNVNINSVYLKIDIDFGRGKLMFDLSLVPKTGSISQSEAPKFLESFKLTGVKRLFSIACTPAKETSTNVKIILDKLKISEWNFEYKFVADLRCINKLIGLGNHKS